MNTRFRTIFYIFVFMFLVLALSCGTVSDNKTDNPTKKDTSPPTTPVNLKAAAINSSEINLTWDASTDDVGVTGYYIFRNGNQVNSSSANSFVDTGLTPATTYAYTVKAYDAVGNTSGDSNQASATTLNSEDSTDVSALIQEAKDALEAQDIPTAKQKFELAYSIDPANKDANFGFAITKGIMLIEDPDIVNIIEKWGGYAPTVEQIIYGALTNTFEVYGTNDYDYNRDPVKSGYTKLTTNNSVSPYTYSGSYTYYIVYVPPFSQVTFDAIKASSGNDNDAYDVWGGVDGWDIGGAGDGKVVTLGEASTNSSGWVIKAKSGSKNVFINTIGTTTALMPKRIAKKMLSLNSQEHKQNLIAQFNILMNKLPKNKQSFLKKAKISLKRSIPTDAPTISEMQTVIDTKILTVINDMIKMLRVVENTGYTFTVTPAMTDDAENKNTELDDGEFYALDGLLCGIKSILNITTAYNLDVDYNIIEADPLSAINGPSGGLTSTLDAAKFFTLKSDGQTKMNTAHTALKELVEKVKAAYLFIFNEWGYTQSGNYLVPTKDPKDNGLQFHDSDYPETSFSVEDNNNAKNGFDAVKMILEGQVTYESKVDKSFYTFTETLSNGSTTITLSVRDAESGDKDFSIVFNAAKFFTNPLDRTDLPAMDYELPINGPKSQELEHPVYVHTDNDVIDVDVQNKSDLPDWTFNGIFPNKIPGIDGGIYFNQAAVLDANIVWGNRDWNDHAAFGSDGNIYLRKELQNNNYSTTQIRIFKINPSTGVIITTYSGIKDYSNNSNVIEWISQMVWHNNNLWASGNYYDSASYSGKIGVFSVNLSKPGNILSKIPIDFSSYNNYGIGGIASDGTNMYLGIEYYSNSVWQKSGIVKFNPANLNQIPTSPFIFDTGEDGAPWRLSYDGTYLWVTGDNIKKIDPSSGAVIKSYTGNDEPIGMYKDGKFWMIDGRKLLSFVAP
ncbi:MAG: fibronectin type III domain-containing protein [Candidatus Firestonebacteria bacterium]|nr:fibronectin type III domain-containing protein [Candidatus Firestonebacteria bacterium]